LNYIYIYKFKEPILQSSESLIPTSQQDEDCSSKENNDEIFCNKNILKNLYILYIGIQLIVFRNKISGPVYLSGTPEQKMP
jgi:hypothetical protein